MRAAIYARVSTSDQNCESQLSELRQFVQRHGWEPAGEYVDTLSGSKASRPALDKLTAAAKRREFDCIVVWKLDRFGRSVLHLSQQLAALTSYGVRFISTTQGLDTDASNPCAKLMLTLLACVAEFERELIIERTVAGIEAARKRGVQLGRRPRVFRRDEVTRLRAEGKSWSAISKALGVPVGTCRGACEPVEMAQSAGLDSSGGSPSSPCFFR
jgi:DNA invertase Pin-like site-specific DNA recombinase